MILYFFIPLKLSQSNAFCFVTHDCTDNYDWEMKGGKINEEEMVCDGVSDVGPYGLR